MPVRQRLSVERLHSIERTARNRTGVHSPRTGDKPQGQSSFHTWFRFAADIAASASAEISQGEALLPLKHDPWSDR